jgi:hypothetical protein
MNDFISPYLVALILVVMGALYGYYIGHRDGYSQGREDGWNSAFDRERKL